MLFFIRQISTEKYNFVYRLTKFNGSILIGKTRSEQEVFSGVRLTSVLAGDIVVSMRTIPPVAKKGGLY